MRRSAIAASLGLFMMSLAIPMAGADGSTQTTNGAVAKGSGMGKAEVEIVEDSEVAKSIRKWRTEATSVPQSTLIRGIEQAPLSDNQRFCEVVANNTVFCTMYGIYPEGGSSTVWERGTTTTPKGHQIKVVNDTSTYDWQVILRPDFTSETTNLTVKFTLEMYKGKTGESPVKVWTSKTRTVTTAAKVFNLKFHGQDDELSEALGANDLVFFKLNINPTSNLSQLCEPRNPKVPFAGDPYTSSDLVSCFMFRESPAITATATPVPPTPTP